MAYKPQISAATTVEELVRFVEEELRQVEKGQAETTALDLRPIFAEPLRPREGLIVYADGTTWDPGSGEGVYVYQNGVWSRFTSAAGFYNVKDFGATGDQVTDDTAAIQDALDTVPSGGLLYFPTGFYSLLGSGSACLTRTTPINIVGDGHQASVLFFNASVPNTRDGLVMTMGANAQGIHIRDIGFSAGNLGRHVLKIDAGASQLLHQVHIEDVYISKSNAGRSIYLVNNIAYSTIERCNLDSILLEDTGDGFTIRENVIGGSGNACIQASFTAGAGGFCVIGNVIAGTGAHIIIEDGGHAPVIAFNEFETPVSVANTYGFLVDIGSASAVGGARLEGNGYSVLASTSNPIPIRVRTGALNTQIKEAKILNQTGAHIQVDSGALDTAIDRTCWAVTSNLTVPLNVTDSGSRTGFISSIFSIELTASQTGTDTSAAQTWFPGGGATSFTLRESSVYEFEGSLATVKTQGTATRNVEMGFGGTAGIESILYNFLSATADQTTFPIVASPLFSPVEQETPVTVIGPSTSSSQAFVIEVKGKLRTSTVAGTFGPQFKYSAAPGGAPTVRKHTYFRMWEWK